MPVTLAPYPRLAKYPVLATCAFVLDSPPVSLNRTYGTRAIERGEGDARRVSAMMYKTTAAGERAETIQRGANMSRQYASDSWPSDPWQVAHVRLSIYAFNTRGDAANEVKLAADACQGVLYANDRVVSIGEIPRPESDGTKGPRVEYVFDLLEVVTPLQARAMELETLLRREGALLKKGRSPGTRAVLFDLQEVRAKIAACRQRMRALANPPNNQRSTP